MSNDFYNASSLLPRRTKARTANVNDNLEAIAAGFDKLPGELAIRENRVTYAADVGAANAPSISFTPAITSYVDGAKFRFKSSNTSTGASCTFDAGPGVRSLVLPDGTDPLAGDITNGDFVEVVYESSNNRFVLTSATRRMGSTLYSLTAQESDSSHVVVLRSILGLPTRADLVTLISEGFSVPDGTVINGGPMLFVASAGATAISDMAGWLPHRDVYPDHFTQNTTPGTTDMAAAIIAAGDYVNDNGGGAVRFQSAIYLVSDQCLFDDYIGVHFEGVATRGPTTSAGTEIKIANSANKTIFKFTHSTKTEKSRIKVRNIGFNGNRGNQTYATCKTNDTGHAVHVSDVDNVEVSGILTRGMAGHSIYFSDGPCNDSKVFDCFLYDSGRTAIKGPTLADSEIYNIEIAGAGKFAYDEAGDINDGVAVGSDGNTITDISFWQVIGVGIDISGDRNMISGGRGDGCTRALVQIDGQGNMVSDIQLFGGGVTKDSRDTSPGAQNKSAVRIKATASDTVIANCNLSPFKKVHGNEDYTTVQNYSVYDEGAATKITGNKCNGNYLDGIYAGGKRSTITDNDCFANRQKGIRITGADVIAENNNCLLNDDGIHNTGTGSIIRDNQVSELASGFSSTLSADMGSGDSTISVASASGLTVGDPIAFVTDDGLYYLNWVDGISTNTLTLRHPINGGDTVATSGNAVVNARQAYGVYLGNAAIAALSGNIASGNATADIFDNDGAAHTGSLADLRDLNRDSNSREVTISSGAITVYRGFVTVDTESDGATDDLDTITAPGAVIGDQLVLRAQNGARTVVVKNGTGNIYLQSGADYSLDDTNKGAVLTFNGTAWNG